MDIKDMDEEQLRAELDKVKTEAAAAAEPAPSAPEPVAAPVVADTEEQWAEIEEKSGMTRQQLLTVNNIADMKAKPIQEANRLLVQKLSAKDNVVAAINKAKSGDPQFGKYQTHVQSYLDGLSEEVKADPKALEAHMDIAVNYGRGKTPRLNERAPEPFGGLEQEAPPVPGAVNSDDEYLGKLHMSPDYNIRLDLEKRVPDEYRKFHNHPSNIGVRIKQSAEWKSIEKAHREHRFSHQEAKK